MKRGQISTEFIAILAILILILLAVIVAMDSRRAQVFVISEKLAGKRVVDSLADTIARVHIGGEGYAETYYIPQRLDGRLNYSIGYDQRDQIVWATWDNDVHTAPVPTRNISTTEFNRGQTITISKINGGIVIG